MLICEASAFIIREGREELVLERVDSVEQEKRNLRFITIFGERKILPAKIKNVSGRS